MSTTKTIAITGATSGIGLATSEELLKKGHKLIFLVRNTEKAQDVIANWDKKENVSIIHGAINGIDKPENLYVNPIVLIDY
jgi:short-subunit dehydrogenase